MSVGPEQDSPPEPAVEDHDLLSSEPPEGSRHSHAIDFGSLQSAGRFVRDSRLGGMFHGGKVSLREDSSKGSLHVSLGQDNRVSVHIDRYSPLGELKPGRRRGYSVRRVILHNVGIVVDYVILAFHRRFGEQRCELECERVCADDHDEEGTSAVTGRLPTMDEAPPETVASIILEEESKPADGRPLPTAGSNGGGVDQEEACRDPL